MIENQFLTCIKTLRLMGVVNVNGFFNENYYIYIYVFCALARVHQ